MTPEIERAMHAHTLKYRGFIIKIKRDFGNGFHLIDGMPCAFGYVITGSDGMWNACPGAGWFQTVKNAKLAIDIIIGLGGDPADMGFEGNGVFDAQEFHRRYKEASTNVPVTHVVLPRELSMHARNKAMDRMTNNRWELQPAFDAIVEHYEKGGQ